MAEPIEIIIRQGGQGGLGFSGGSGNQQVGPGIASGSRGSRTGLLSGSMEPGEGLMKQLTLGDAALIGTLKSQIKQGIYYSITQYGNTTGNYIEQRNIRNALSLASTLSAVVIGSVVGGPVGMVASVVLAGTSIVAQKMNYDTDIRKQNIQAEFMRERAGSTLGSGSRGTYE